ncbi:MAG TPA: hypothetical protein VGS07_09540 [Thermoanaerobaculia bacterium]|nr:hypothetical protein [Thermoanaerobaculia bacterium]
MATLFAGLAVSAQATFAENSKPACPRKSKADLVFQLPSLGELKLWTYVVPTGYPRGIAVLCDSQGRLLRKVTIPQGMPGDIKARKYDVPGWPSPVLAIASSWPRADGITIDAVLLTLSSLGQLKEVLPRRHLDFADALCLGTTSDSRPSVDLLESVTGNQCFMCWPKRFQVTTYLWNRSDLTRQSMRTTRHKHKDYRSAVRELKMTCPVEVLQATAQQEE